MERKQLLRLVLRLAFFLKNPPEIINHDLNLCHLRDRGGQHQTTLALLL